MNIGKPEDPFQDETFKDCTGEPLGRLQTLN